jgi:DNA-binding GntR family transcriptional regulator
MRHGRPLLKTVVTATSIVDQVIERIEAAIFSGELKVGERFSEQALAAGMGTSRGPLREALRQLEGRGLIERVPNIGVCVAPYLGKSMEDVLAIREALEPMACRLAASRISEPDLKKLRTLLKKHEARTGTSRSYHDTPDHDFHQLIVVASENQKLQKIIFDDLYYLMRFHRYRSGATPGRSEAALKEHHAILAALEARSPDDAEAAMRIHLVNAHANMLANNTPRDKI